MQRTVLICQPPGHSSYKDDSDNNSRTPQQGTQADASSHGTLVGIDATMHVAQTLRYLPTAYGSCSHTAMNRL